MIISKISGVKYNLVRLGMLVNIWWIGCKTYKNPITSIKVVRLLVQNFTRMIGQKKLVRAFKVDKLYYWDIFNPGWPSPGFNAFFKSHLLELKPVTGEEQLLRRLIVAITKRCPLQCEHCSEAATLYQKDILTYQEYIDKIDPFVEKGIGQLVFSGGEPLSRFEDLILILNRYRDRCDQWIYTSAFGLNLEKAIQLKAAGLNGVAISLDHHIKEEHNKFRGNQKSYDWVLEGIKSAQEAGLLVSLNVCPTKEYIESGGPEKLIELGKELNVSIIVFLEPRAVGNFENKDVELQEVHKEQLSELSNKYNFQKSNLDYPTVLFPAGYRKALSCGGGKSYLFLDFDGTLYPCPFCKTKMPEIKTKESLCIAS